MRIALLSDIHGNCGALRAVINDAQSHGYDKIFCLGDIIGYGAYPKECLDIVREYCSEIVMGNHEEIAFDFKIWESKLVNELALAGIRHALKQLSDEDVNFIKQLPRKKIIQDFDLTISHAAFRDPTWTYIKNEHIAEFEMTYLETKLGFIGHTHVPAIYTRSSYDDSKVAESTYLDCQLSNISKCIINVGSVGQPRNGDPRAHYGLLEFTDGTVQYKDMRVEYNIEQAARDFIEAGLPKRSAYRLFDGR